MSTPFPNDRLPLHGLRVVDSTVERGELCARLLADLGADVVRAEPPGGVASRHLPPFAPDGTSLSFAVRNTNKRSVTVDGPAALDPLLAAADVWVDSSKPGTVDHDEVLLRHPHLVIVSITDFGLTGPYAGFEATDDVLFGMSGMLCRSGAVGLPPVLAPGMLSYDTASTMAAFAAMAALWQRRSTGRGQVLDVSVMQAVAQITDWGLPNWSSITQQGGVYSGIRNGSGPVYPMYPCADGFVRLIILSARQWRSMRAWLGEPPELQDDALDGLIPRMMIQEEVLDPIFINFFQSFTAADLADQAQKRGIVMTPVLKPHEVPNMAHFIERGTFVDDEAARGVKGKVASGFLEFDGGRVGYRSRSPQPGEHDATIDWPSTAPAAQGYEQVQPEAALPFAGLHVLDFGHGGVGVETGRLFAEYGADVIKVETHTYPDFIRMVSGAMMSPSFASSSRCKRSLGVNAKTEAGHQVIAELLKWADLMIENTSTGTMADIGLSYEEVKAVNPGIVMVSSQLMGSRGPWKDWIGYGPSTRPPGGMTHLWNFPDGGMPPGSGAIHPDHFVGRMGAVGGLAALLGRDGFDPDNSGSGAGVHVEVAQVEALVNLLGDLFLKEDLAPGTVDAEGNRDERGAPWGVYQCAGEERWVVITIRDDEEWERFTQAIGNPAWAQAQEYATVAGRRAAADEIDERIEEWTSQRSDVEAMHALQAAGVAAGMMTYPSDFASDPHFIARRYPRPAPQPGIGELMFEGPAFLSTSIADPLVSGAPKLGEHTREICKELLAMTDGEIDKLIADGALEEPRD